MDTNTKATTALATLTTEVLDKAQAEMEAEGLTYDATPTGHYYVDDAGATWVQVQDHVNQNNTYWFSQDREDLNGIWQIAGVSNLDEITELAEALDN